MRLRRDQRGFVLSGTGLLLVLPAMLLTASLLTVMEIGGETTSLQATADKVFYIGNDVERVIWDIWEENMLFDNENNTNDIFAGLADNYRASTGLQVSITPSWKLWTYATRVDENRYAGTEYCRIARASSENWYYYFDINFDPSGDPDYNEPILLVTKVGGDLRITLENYHYPVGSDNWSHIYYDDTLLWDNVIDEDPRIGDDNTITGTTTQLTVSFEVRDPRGIARYLSSVDLG